MKTYPLSMPRWVAELITLPMHQLGLTVTAIEQNVISCPINYEDGTEVSVLISCVARKRFLIQDAKFVSVTFAIMGSEYEVRRILHQDTMALPANSSDISFVFKLSAKVRAIGWSLAGTTEMGRCVEFTKYN